MRKYDTHVATYLRLVPNLVFAFDLLIFKTVA